MKRCKEIPILIFKIDRLEKEDRTFSGWGTVEIRDKQGDIIDISVFEDIMPIVMKRGGVLMDSHSNRHVGKLTHWEIKDKGDTKGLWLEAQIFNDFKIDDEIWGGVKDGSIIGFSLGGDTQDISFECDGNECIRRISGLEVFEWSVVRNPANPEALIENINRIAKTMQVDKPTCGMSKNINKKNMTNEENETKQNEELMVSEAKIRDVENNLDLLDKVIAALKRKEPQPSQTKVGDIEGSLDIIHQAIRSLGEEVKVKEAEEAPAEAPAKTPDDAREKVEDVKEVVAQLVEAVAALSEEIKSMKSEITKEKINEIAKKVVDEKFKSLSKSETPRPEVDTKHPLAKDKVSLQDIKKMSWAEVHNFARVVEEKGKNNFMESEF